MYLVYERFHNHQSHYCYGSRVGYGCHCRRGRNEGTINLLQQQHCDRGQGYLFSEPLSAKELVKVYRSVEQKIHRDGKPEEMATMQLAINNDGGTLLVKAYMNLDKVQNIVKSLLDKDTLSIYGNRIYGLRGTAFIEIHKRGRVLMVHSSEKGIVSYLHKKLSDSFENVEQSCIEDIIKIE